MSYRHHWLPLALFAVVSLMLAACGGPAAAPATSTDPSGQASPAGQTSPAANTPKRGGTLRPYNSGASFSNTDPAMGQASYNGWPIISEYMLRRDTNTFAIVPAAIEQWDFSADGKELTLKVRPGVKFHNKAPVNGREVEAKDIVYTIKGITGMLYPDLPSVRFPRRSELGQLKDIVAVDTSTVKITLTEPAASFLDGLTEYRSAIVLPEGLREHFGGVEALSTHYVERSISAGPFTLTKFTDQVEVEYTRNPDYYEPGKPYLEKIHQVWIPDRATAVAAFVAGQVDLMQLINPDERDLAVKSKPDANVVSFAPTTGWYRLAFNTTRKPFDDVRVRRAFALALDPVLMGNQFFGEWQGKPLWRYPGPLPWTFPEALPQEELAKLPFYESPKSQQTIAEAKKLLADAGLGDGLEFEILTPVTGTIDFKGGAALIGDQLQKTLGNVKFNIKALDTAINQQLAAKGEFDVQFYSHIHDSTGVAMMKTGYHSKGGRNYPRYNDPKMDQLLDVASQELDTEKRKQLMYEAQRLALETVPWMPIMHTQYQMALQPRVQGVRLGAGSEYQVYYKEVWLAE